MPDPQDFAVRGRSLRTMQVIAGAMLVSVLLCLGFALFSVYGQNGGALLAPGGLPVVSLAALVVLATNAPLALALPGIQTAKALGQIASGTWNAPTAAGFSAEEHAAAAADYSTDAGKLMFVRMTTLIIRFALLEGAAIFGSIAFLLEAQPYTLGAVAAALWLMAASFPTQGSVRAWLERQLEQLAELRLKVPAPP